MYHPLRMCFQHINNTYYTIRKIGLIPNRGQYIIMC